MNKATFFSRRSQWLLAAVMAAALSGRATGQVEAKKAMPAPPKVQEAQKMPAPPKAAMPVLKAAPMQALGGRILVGEVQNVMWSDEQVDQWVFQQDRSAGQGRRRLESQLSLHLDGVEKSCK